MTLCLPLPYLQTFVGMRTTLDPPVLIKDDLSTLKPAGQRSHFPFANKLTLLMGFQGLGCGRHWGGVGEATVLSTTCTDH